MLIVSTLINSTKERDLSCSFSGCEKLFSSQVQLRRHIRSTHESLEHLGQLSADISRHPRDNTFIAKPVKSSKQNQAKDRHKSKKSKVTPSIHVMFSGVDRVSMHGHLYSYYLIDCNW